MILQQNRALVRGGIERDPEASDGEIMHQLSPSKPNRKRRVVRPLVYSAIGSLEFVNQNSFGSFNQKLYQSCKPKPKIAERIKTEIHKPRKAKEDGGELVHVDESNFLKPKV